MSVKGSWKRPQTVTRAELELRHEFAKGIITEAVFEKEYARLKRIGLIRRSGKVLK